MRLIDKLSAAAGILALGILACNLPVNAPNLPTEVPSSPPQQIDLNDAMTLAVQTLQSAAQNPQNAPVTAPPGSSTPTPITTPMVSVSSDTNCRTGPGVDYDLVILFPKGLSAEVIAKYSPSNYWIIKYPGGGGNSCWLWGAYATVIGNVNNLPEAVPPPLPPTPTLVPSAPNPPKAPNIACTSKNVSTKVGNLWILKFQWTVTFSWKDNSGNEDGFYVFKDGSQVATLGPNSTSYKDIFNVMLSPSQVTHTYGVQSFNQFGASAMKEADLTTCP